MLDFTWKKEILLNKRHEKQGFKDKIAECKNQTCLCDGILA